MNKTNEIDNQFFSSVVETVLSLEKSKILSIDDIYKIAKKAIELEQIKNSLWLENEISEHLKIHLKENKSVDQSAFLNSIKVSSPKNIKNKGELVIAENDHKMWMDSVRSSGTILYGRRANFIGANLSGYSLEKLNFSCANFDRASLIGANLAYANLAKCSFVDANLQGANLYHTNFKGAKMKGCDLRDADIENCNFEGVDLSNVTLDSKYLNLFCHGQK